MKRNNGLVSATPNEFGADDAHGVSDCVDQVFTKAAGKWPQAAVINSISLVRNNLSSIIDQDIADETGLFTIPGGTPYKVWLWQNGKDKFVLNASKSMTVYWSVSNKVGSSFPPNGWNINGTSTGTSGVLSLQAGDNDFILNPDLTLDTDDHQLTLSFFSDSAMTSDSILTTIDVEVPGVQFIVEGSNSPYGPSNSYTFSDSSNTATVTENASSYLRCTVRNAAGSFSISMRLQLTGGTGSSEDFPDTFFGSFTGTNTASYWFDDVRTDGNSRSPATYKAFYYVPTADWLTEGQETVSIDAQVQTRSGTWVTAQSFNLNIVDAITAGTWTISNSATSIPEGGSYTFTATNSNGASGTLWVYFRQIDSTLTNADTDRSIGTYYETSVTNGVLTFTVNAASDQLAEGTERFWIDVYRKLNDGSYSYVGAQSGNISITNVSPNIALAFQPLSLNVIQTTLSSDYTGSYETLGYQLPSGYGGSKRIYLAFKIGTNTTYYNDICVAGVQIQNSAGTSVLQDYIFNTNTGGSGSGWQTDTTQLNGTAGATPGLSIASGRTYSSISTTTGVNRVSWATSTGSSRTGMRDGVSNTYYSTVFPSFVTQGTGTYYMYREASGSTRYSVVFCRSPLYTFSGGEQIKVCCRLVTSSGQSFDPDDLLYLGVA